MTGKQYFEKYKDRAKEIKVKIDSAKDDHETGHKALMELNEMIRDILVEMNLEVSELGELRKITTRSALDSIAEDMNRRWNKMASLFEKELGDSLVAPDGYKKFYANVCREIESDTK